MVTVRLAGHENFDSLLLHFDNSIPFQSLVISKQVRFRTILHLLCDVATCCQSGGGSVGGYCRWCFVLGDCGRFAEVGQVEVTVRWWYQKKRFVFRTMPNQQGHMMISDFEPT